MTKGKPNNEITSSNCSLFIDFAERYVKMTIPNNSDRYKINKTSSDFKIYLKIYRHELIKNAIEKRVKNIIDSIFSKLICLNSCQIEFSFIGKRNIR